MVSHIVFLAVVCLVGCVTDSAAKYKGGYQGTIEVDRNIVRSSHEIDQDLFFQGVRLEGEFGDIAKGFSFGVSLGQSHGEFRDQTGDSAEQNEVTYTLSDTLLDTTVYFNQPYWKLGTRLSLGASKLSHELTDEELAAIEAAYDDDPTIATTTPRHERHGTRYKVAKLTLLSRFPMVKVEYGSVDLDAYLTYGKYIGEKHCSTYEICGDAFSDYDDHTIMGAGAGVSMSLTETPLRGLGHLLGVVLLVLLYSI